MDKYKVGQLVRIVKPAVEPLIGVITSIIRQREIRKVKNIVSGNITNQLVYTLDYEYNEGRKVGATEEMLIPIYDEDSNKISSWEKSIWKPNLKEKIQ